MTGVGSQCLFYFTSVQPGLYVTNAKAKKQSARRQMTSAQEKTGSGYVARLNTVSVLFLLACLVLVSKVKILHSSSSQIPIPVLYFSGISRFLKP